MDARDLCRRLNCPPATLAKWLEEGCPVHRDSPFAWYDLDEVERWLTDRGIQDWPREDDHTLDVPLRSLFKALARREITPWDAEKIVFLLGELA